MGKNSYLVREIVGTMVFVQGLGWPCAKVCIGQIGPFLGQNFGHRLGHLANFSRVQWQRSAQPAPPPASKAGRLSKRPLFLIFWPLITTCLGILARSWFEGDWVTMLLRLWKLRFGVVFRRVSTWLSSTRQARSTGAWLGWKCGGSARGPSSRRWVKSIHGIR